MISASPFIDASELRDALLKSIKGIQVSPELLKTDVTAMKDALIEASTSPEVRVALFKCLERATYDGVRVNVGLFDDPQLGERAREDYYNMAWKAVEVNCLPFLRRISSLLKAGFEKAPSVSPA